jgi:adenylyltransferase/sulfurtransferase
MMTNEQVMRYGRHLIMPEVGVEGQEKINAAKVLLIGAGGLGSPSALYLAASGVGHMTIIDPDVVDLSNLQRQIIHDTSSVGVPKAESAKKRIAEINPNVKVNAIQDMINNDNVLPAGARARHRGDGTDNFQTRYMVNDACVFEKKLNVYGSIFVSTARARFSAIPKGRAIAACIPSRRRPAWCPLAPKVEYSEFCPASSA